MTDRRPLHLSIAVVLVLLLVALPATADAGGNGASVSNGTGAQPVQGGSPAETTPSTGDSPGPADTGTPTPATKTKAVPAATTAAPGAQARGDDRPESGDTGNGERAAAPGGATTVPTATPSATPTVTGARTGGNLTRAAAGEAWSGSGTAEPTGVPTPAGQARSMTGGDGGREPTAAPTAAPTADAKDKSAATAAPTNTPQATRAGSASDGGLQYREAAVGDTSTSRTAPGAGRTETRAGEEAPSSTVAAASATSAGPGVDVTVTAPPSTETGATTRAAHDPAPETDTERSSGRHGTDAAGFGVVSDGTGGRHGGADDRNGTATHAERDDDGAVLRERPGPTVSPGADGLSGAPVMARAALPAHRDRHGRGGARPGDGGGRRGAPLNPEPLAAPVRTGLEPPQPAGGLAGRTKHESSSAPVGDAEGGAPDPFLLLRFLLFLGYRRVRPGNLLDHPVRRDLAAAIAADPGLDLAACVAATGANRETLRYHLALLVCGGKVAEETRNGSVAYFPSALSLAPAHRAVLQLRRNPSLAPLLHHIRDAPGISRRELADLLGVAGPSVTRQVQRLVDEGLVERRRCGQSQRYWLTPGCADAFAAIAMAEGARDRGVVSPDRASA